MPYHTNEHQTFQYTRLVIAPNKDRKIVYAKPTGLDAKYFPLRFNAKDHTWQEYLKDDTILQVGFTHISEDGSTLFISLRDSQEESESVILEILTESEGLFQPAIDYIALVITSVTETLTLSCTHPALPITPPILQWQTVEVTSYISELPKCMTPLASNTPHTAAVHTPPTPVMTNTTMTQPADQAPRWFEFMGTVHAADASEMPPTDNRPSVTDYTHAALDKYLSMPLMQKPSKSGVELISSALYDAIVLAVGRGMLDGPLHLIPQIKDLYETLCARPYEYFQAEKRMEARIEGSHKDERVFVWVSGKILGWLFSDTSTISTPTYRIDETTRQAWIAAGYRIFENNGALNTFLPVRDLSLADIKNTKGKRLYHYCITKDGVAHIADYEQNGREVKHDRLALGADVFLAGEAFFEDGKLIRITEDSGHYLPRGPNLEKIAEDACTKSKSGISL